MCPLSPWPLSPCPLSLWERVPEGRVREADDDAQAIGASRGNDNKKRRGITPPAFAISTWPCGRYFLFSASSAMRFSCACRACSISAQWASQSFFLIK